jgi:prolyl-tRNA editing enzyme YbaK/EbsC (Cys-tRNA(Pro) deacylase)
MASMTTHPGHAKLLAELDAARIEYDVLAHRRTMTAADEAEALGVAPSAVAKTVVLTTPTGFARAVLPASEHLDLRKVRTLFDTNEIALATEEQLAGAYPEYELGAVPPLGGSKDAVVLDTRIAASDSLLVEAGVHDASVRLKTDDLVAHTHARVADLCRD